MPPASAALPIADTPPGQPQPVPSPATDLQARSPSDVRRASPPAGPGIARPLIAFSPPIPDIYLPASAVDVRADPINDVMLEYPEQAFLEGISGKVVLMLLINENGSVDDVILGWADPPGYFEQVAVQAARETRFSPAMKSGRPVKSRKLVEIEFTPRDSGADGP
ncbi:MAG: TonB family protein [Betaproteobacteria bacterium]|nr:TonB family protein [Betaproteobacteria bacterium]